MPAKNIQIRKARKEDLPQILDLVIELAIYEKEPDAVTASIADYEEGFTIGLFDCIVAIANKNMVGMALFFPTYSTWKGRMLTLEDLVVTESFRKEGIGQLLFDAVLEEAKNNGCRLLKWQVLDWNIPALRFYEKNNAIIEKNWWTGKIIFNQ